MDGRLRSILLLPIALLLGGCVEGGLVTGVADLPTGASLLGAVAGSTPVQVSAGGFHTCALGNDGEVACWGENLSGQAMPPGGTFVQVSAGTDHTCALGEDGAVVCWGLNVEGQATPPEGRFVQVSAGEFHTCALGEDGGVACWGWDLNGQATPPLGITFVQVSAGGRHTCAVREDEAVVCWGRNVEGQATPPLGITFVQVSAGHLHTCAVGEDGEVACWGSNSQGQATPPGGTFVKVSAGRIHTCGVRESGAVACWGSNSDGQTEVPPEFSNVATTGALTVAPAIQQYSDFVTLSVSLEPASASGTVEFFVEDGEGWAFLGTETVVGGAASRVVQVTSGAGPVTYRAVFTAGEGFTDSEHTATLTVTREDAVVLWDEGNPAELTVPTADGSLAPGELALTVRVREAMPDPAVAPGTPGAGNVANAALSVSLVPGGAGPVHALACTPGAVVGAGYDAVRPFVCTNVTGVPIGAYTVQASVTGAFYTGSHTGAFGVILDPFRARCRRGTIPGVRC